MIEFSSLSEIADWLRQQQVRSLFLVLDRVAYEQSGARQVLAAENLPRRVEFDAFEPNPKLTDIRRGLDLFRREPCEAIMAIGGGTAIDIAKSIRCFAVNDCPPIDLLRGESRIKPQPACPLIAVPTTAGTGSEATHFAVVYVEALKYSLADSSLLPEVAVLDASLTESLPAQVTATSGLDALCQAVESMWSIHSTTASMQVAEEALDLAWNHLRSAVQQPTREHRQAMLRAAHLAGQAINITKTTGPHALSYAITAGYGVPHGHAVVLTLGAFLRYNAAVTAKNLADPRGLAHVHRTIQRICTRIGADNPHAAAASITSLVEAIGCPSRLRQLGVRDRGQLATLAQSVNAQRLSNNPRTASAQDLRDILDSVY